MTRNEFLDNVNDWAELIEFCYDVDCSYCEDIYSEYDRENLINEFLMDWARDADSWRGLLSSLNAIPDGYDYYKYDRYGEWEGLDDDSDFYEVKDDVLDWMDCNEYWDEDDDCFDEEPMEDCDDEGVEEEDFSAAELIGMCSAAFATIQQESLQRSQMEDEQFDNFINLNIPKVLK